MLTQFLHDHILSLQYPHPHPDLYSHTHFSRSSQYNHHTQYMQVYDTLLRLFVIHQCRARPCMSFPLMQYVAVPQWATHRARPVHISESTPLQSHNHRREGVREDHFPHLSTDGTQPEMISGMLPPDHMHHTGFRISTCGYTFWGHT